MFLVNAAARTVKLADSVNEASDPHSKGPSRAIPTCWRMLLAKRKKKRIGWKSVLWWNSFSMDSECALTHICDQIIQHERSAPFSLEYQRVTFNYYNSGNCVTADLHFQLRNNSYFEIHTLNWNGFIWNYTSCMSNKQTLNNHIICRCDFRTGYGRGAVGIQIRHGQPQCQYVRTFRAAGLCGRHKHGGRLQVVEIEWVLLGRPNHTFMSIHNILKCE